MPVFRELDGWRIWAWALTISRGVMNPKYFLRRHSWASIFYSKPDDQGGAGGGENPPKAEGPKTLKDALAVIEAARVSAEAKDLEIAGLEKKASDAEALAATSAKDLAAAVAVGEGLKSELATAQASLVTVTGERDEAKKAVTTQAARVGHLEKLCHLKGVDPNQAVAQESEKDDSTEAQMKAVADRMASATDPKEKFKLASQLSELRKKAA